MHIWGDDWPHWDDLAEAHEKIILHFERMTRLTLISKEKYGSIRYECILSTDKDYQITIHDWKFLWDIIQYYIKQYPHLEDELTEDIAAMEEVVGKEVHDKYWRTCG